MHSLWDICTNRVKVFATIFSKILHISLAHKGQFLHITYAMVPWWKFYSFKFVSFVVSYIDNIFVTFDPKIMKIYPKIMWIDPKIMTIDPKIMTIDPKSLLTQSNFFNTFIYEYSLFSPLPSKLIVIPNILRQKNSISAV